jgi:hypothetical protein
MKHSKIVCSECVNYSYNKDFKKPFTVLSYSQGSKFIIQVLIGDNLNLDWCNV